MEKNTKKLLEIVQRSFPLTSRPYKKLGGALSIKEEDVFKKVLLLLDKGSIKRIGPVFDSRSLGFQSTLIGMEVPEKKVEDAVQIINSIDGVTHNYLRKDKLNMWFTLSCPTKKDLGRQIEYLREKISPKTLLNLPAKRQFKIDLTFQLCDNNGRGQRTSPASKSLKKRRVKLTSEDKRIIAHLSGGLPRKIQPFSFLAGRIGISEHQLIRWIKCGLKSGIVRKFVGTLNQRMIGLNSNALGVWCVPSQRIVKVGKLMAGFHEVTHCYERPKDRGWKYNLYTMIHGRDKKKCEAIAKEISDVTGVKDYKLLWTVRELKRSRMKYFPISRTTHSDPFTEWVPRGCPVGAPR